MKYLFELDIPEVIDNVESIKFKNIKGLESKTRKSVACDICINNITLVKDISDKVVSSPIVTKEKPDAFNLWLKELGLTSAKDNDQFLIRIQETTQTHMVLNYMFDKVYNVKGSVLQKCSKYQVLSLFKRIIFNYEFLCDYNQLQNSELDLADGHVIMSTFVTMLSNYNYNLDHFIALSDKRLFKAFLDVENSILSEVNDFYEMDYLLEMPIIAFYNPDVVNITITKKETEEVTTLITTTPSENLKTEGIRRDTKLLVKIVDMMPNHKPLNLIFDKIYSLDAFKGFNEFQLKRVFKKLVFNQDFYITYEDIEDKECNLAKHSTLLNSLLILLNSHSTLQLDELPENKLVELFKYVQNTLIAKPIDLFIPFYAFYSDSNTDDRLIISEVDNNARSTSYKPEKTASAYDATNKLDLLKEILSDKLTLDELCAYIKIHTKQPILLSNANMEYLLGEFSRIIDDQLYTIDFVKTYNLLNTKYMRNSIRTYLHKNSELNHLKQIVIDYTSDIPSAILQVNKIIYDFINIYEKVRPIFKEGFVINDLDDLDKYIFDILKVYPFITIPRISKLIYTNRSNDRFKFNVTNVRRKVDSLVVKKKLSILFKDTRIYCIANVSDVQVKQKSDIVDAPLNYNGYPEVLNFIKNNPNCTSDVVAKGLSYTAHHACNVLWYLTKKGKIIKSSNSKPFTYKIKEA